MEKKIANSSQLILSLTLIEGKKYKSRKCKDAEVIEIALKLIYQSKNEKKICEKEKDILKKVDANILEQSNEKLSNKNDSKNVENTVFESSDLNQEDSSMTRILLESNHESENPKSDNIEIEKNVFESLEIESDDYEEAEEKKINFENEKNSGKSQVNVMCKICQKPYVGLLKVGWSQRVFWILKKVNQNSVSQLFDLCWNFEGQGFHTG